MGCSGGPRPRPDPQLAAAVGATEGRSGPARRASGSSPSTCSVDTCAGEFEASTPYHYSTYEETEVRPLAGAVVVLGSGPNRIGQGVEFDTIRVHAVQALREAGYETVMVNCNPETVSTDYDIADRLYVEPLTCEDVPGGVPGRGGRGRPRRGDRHHGRPDLLQLAHGAGRGRGAAVGTPPDAIDLAETGPVRDGPEQCGLDAPPWGQATTVEQALAVAERVGYPVPSAPPGVLGGRLHGGRA